jgi:predicted dehydrogenase
MANETSDITRRGSLAALGAMALLAQRRRILGANDRVRVALCGVRGRGSDHLRNYSKLSNVEIAAVCDIDESVSAKCLSNMEKMGIAKPKTYVDVRKLLEDKSIDAVSIATPNHWHALIAIWACQAGKDVYVEKPCTHNLWEGQQLIKAATKYNRIVQHGTQIRSNAIVRDAIQKVHDGYLGEVYMTRGVCFKWRDTIGHAPVEPVPAGVDYDLWTGPAPVHPFTRNRFHYNWHWNYLYGNGDLGNQGVHQIDVARWALGAGFPTKVSAIGGHFMFDDDQDTPNDLVCAFEFNLPGGKHRMISFEVRHWMTNHEAGLGTPDLATHSGNSNSVGNVLYGSKGYLSIADEDTGAYKAWLGREQEAQPGVHENDQAAHFRNFINCVISRKKEDLNAPIEEGHISAGLMHLANASYRLGRTIHFDTETQKAVGDAEANAMLRDEGRGYRKPFAVPEKI